jgi:preprotein translocase subunit SecE
MKDKVTKYVKETVQELKKVTWPSKDELIGSTIVTIFVTLVMSIFTFGVDQLFSRVMSIVLS